MSNYSQYYFKLDRVKIKINKIFRKLSVRWIMNTGFNYISYILYNAILKYNFLFCGYLQDNLYAK